MYRQIKVSNDAITKMQAVIAIAVVVVAAIAGAYYYLVFLGPPTESIPVGVIGPFTGFIAVYGEDMKKGAIIGVEDINAMGGVLGRNMTIIWGDDESGSISKGTAAVEMMIEKNVAAVVGGIFTTCVLAEQPIFERAKMPHIFEGGAAVSPPCYSEWIFNIEGNISSGGIVTTSLLINTGFTEYAVVAEDGEWGRATTWDWDNNLKNWGYADKIKRVTVEYVEPGTTDYYVIATKIKSLNVPFVFLALGGISDQLCAKHMHEVGVKAILCATDFGFDAADDFVHVAGEEAANLTTHRTTFWPRTEMPEEIPELFTQKTKEWRIRYKERFGTWPGWVAVRTYDSMFVLAEAIKRAGSVDHEAIREALAGMDSPQTGQRGIGGLYWFRRLTGPEGINSYYNIPVHLIFQRQNLNDVVKYIILYPTEYATGEMILPP